MPRSSRRGLDAAATLGLALALLATACSGGSDAPPTGPENPGRPDGAVASVTVTLPSPAITVGGSVTPQAVARNAAGETVPATFTWTSSNADVASVTAGRATGVTAGAVNLVATVGSVSGSAALRVDPRNLDAMAEAVRAQYGLPALSGAIVSSKGLIGIGVAGTRRATGGPAVTRDDRWHIGSNLKAITAALAAVAVGRGDIQWTTTVAEAFPEHAASMRAEYRAVTLQDLLANRGGIRNDPPASAYAGTTARQQRESLVNWALRQPPAVARGTYHYSNTGFAMAGAMVERAMGGTYEALLDEHLGKPLGVTTLGWGAAAAAGQSNQPVGHFRQGTGWAACEACDNPPGLSAAGRAHMSMPDWARITQAMLAADAGRFAAIKQDDARRMHTGHTVIPNSSDMYGLGWQVTTRPWGGRTVYHTGSNTTNHSVAWLGLDTGLAFLAATNAADFVGGSTGRALDEMVVKMLTLQQGG